MSNHANQSIDLKQSVFYLAVVLIITLISNYLTPLTDIGFFAAAPGFIILFAICLIGLVISKFAPFYLPTVAWISLVSIGLTMPWTPGSAWMSAELGKVNFLAMLPPILAYAGLAITSKEIETFKSSGIKIAIVSLLVFTGTYLGSVYIAEFALNF
jgi:hypothetical protein